MPKGPKGEKRPADVIGAAVKVMKIATGDICAADRLVLECSQAWPRVAIPPPQPYKARGSEP